MKTTRFGITTVAQGQAGVYRVASELMLRGFKVSMPCVDDHGVDLIVTPNIRIQVKSAHLVVRGGLYRNQGAYWFKLGHGFTVSNKSTIRARGTRCFSDQCEFVVLWGIEQGRFWITPSPLMDHHHLVVVGPDVHYQDVDLGTAEKLFTEGLSESEVADRLGVNIHTLVNRRRGRRGGRSSNDTPKLTISSRVRECENKWDLIEAQVNLLREATTVVETPRESAVVIEA